MPEERVEVLSLAYTETLLRGVDNVSV